MHLLLADDHNLFRDSLKALIERADDSSTVTAVGTLDEAITAAKHQPVDIAILDLRMPGMAGLDGIGRFRSNHPELPVLLISGLARPHEVRGALAAGARGFVSKSASPQVLISTVQKVLAGQLVIPTLDGQGPSQPCARDRPAEFTRREHDVLNHLVQGQANKVIARHLNLQEVTVKLHLRSIFRKLKVNSRTQAVLAAVCLDLIHADSPQMQEIRR